MAPKCLFATIVFAATLGAVVSCATHEEPPPKPTDDKLIQSGSALFAQGKLAEAEATWSEIRDSSKREAYLAYAKAYESLEAALSSAEKALAEAKVEEAAAAIKDSPTLPLPPPNLTSADPRFLSSRREKLGAEAGKILEDKAGDVEKAADRSFAAVRSGKTKDGLARAAAAAEAYNSASKLYLAAADWIPSTAEAVSRTAAKAQEAENLHKALLKVSLLSFSARMGAVFARTPSSAQFGDKELLAFAAETASMISGGISDFDASVVKYPDLLDQATVDRLRSSAKGLSARFSRIEAAIKVVKNRGKPVMPIIIGIFNPEPDDPQRSRPAAFAGSTAAGPEWWWGIADIPKGAAQDLVVTMSDSRPVRIYAAGLGPDGKRPASDLVNPMFRVGNSSPVLNAGARLNNGVFHIEVGPGRPDSYSGVAVVYKSFMMRTR